MSSSPVIRPYAEADAAAVQECLAILQEVERAIEPRLMPGYEVAAAILSHMLERGRLWDGGTAVAEVDGRVVGFINVYRRIPLDGPEFVQGDAYAIVSDLAVLEPYRRHGVGTALLRWAEELTRQAGIPELRIGVLEGNEVQKLYAGTGYRPYYAIMIKRVEP